MSQTQTQTQITGKTVVYRDKHTRIILKVDAGRNEVALEKIYYPDARYANNLWEEIVLDVKNKTIYYCEGRESWGGTGSTCTDIKLSDYEFEQIYDDMMKVKSVDSFNDLALNIQAKAYDLDEEEYFKCWLRMYYGSRQDDPEEVEL